MMLSNDYNGLLYTFVAAFIGIAAGFLLSLLLHQRRAKWNKFFAFEMLLGMIIGALIGALINGTIKI